MVHAEGLLKSLSYQMIKEDIFYEKYEDKVAAAVIDKYHPNNHFISGYAGIVFRKKSDILIAEINISDKIVNLHQ